MAIEEIVLPETHPETEWLLDAPVRKVSPKRRHGRLQLEFGTALGTWARGRGQVATEWRFRVAPPGEVRRPLVPDIAFVRNDLLRGLDVEDAEAPVFAPSVAVEILSRDDRAVYVDEKIDVLIRAGAELVIVVDPYARRVSLHDANGTGRLRGNDILTHSALPDFALSLTELFAALDLP
ncbi:MAG: Uma2 family endonuclease [Candidatus Baltobacteraceae bacterium]